MKRLLAIFCFAFSMQTVDCQTFTEKIQIKCGDMALVSPLGYPTWNAPHILQKPALGHAILIGDFIAPNALEYTAPSCFIGFDTVVIDCARATQITCDTGIYIFEISCGEVISPIFANVVGCQDSIYVGNLSGWWFPQILDSAQHGFSKIIFEPTDGAGVFYRPDSGFEGLDFVKVTLGGSGGLDTLLYIFQVYCDLTLKNDEPTAKMLPIFPNPTSDYVQFDFESEIVKLEIFNAVGQVFFPKMISPEARENGQTILTISHLPEGEYFVFGKTGTGSFLGKFLKIN